MRKYIFQTLFVFAILFLLHLVLIGTPMPPGLIHQLGTNYLESHPGYRDIVSGSVSADALVANVDMYSSYLLAVIIILTLWLILPFFIFVLASVVVWNYVLHKTLSVKYYWKSLFYHFLILIIGGVFCTIGYFIITLLGGLSNAYWWVVLSRFLLLAFFIKVLLIYLLLISHFMRTGSIVQSVTHTIHTRIFLRWKLLAASFGCLAFISLVSLLFYVVSLQLTMLLIAISWYLCLAGMHVYVARLR